MSDNPLTIEADERGFILTVNLGDADLREGIPLGGERFAFRLGTTGALELYEHVVDTLGEWAREGLAAKRAVAAGVSLNDYIGDIEDGEWEPVDALLEAGDHYRKARRENG